MVLKRLVFKGIGLISTLILVRLLSPDAFGLAALASTSYDMLNTVAEFSFGLALVKMKQPTRAHYDSAWTLTVLRGFAIGGVIFISAPWIADLLRDQRLVDITRAMALYPVVWGFENIGMIDFQRTLRFDRLFFYDVLGKIVGFVVVIPAAIVLHSAWAVFLGTIAPKLVQIPASFIMHPYRPRFTLKAGSELLNFSKWLFATNILSLANNYVIHILIGRVGGVSSVGLFRTAEQVGMLPVSELAAPIRGPMYSGYAKVLHDGDRLCRNVIDGLSLTLMVITPLSVGIALTAKLIEQVALGAAWAGAAPYIQVCAFYALFEGISEFTHGLYVVKDRQRRFVAIMALTVLIRVVIVIAAGLAYGPLAAAATFALTTLVSSIIWVQQLTVIIHLPMKVLFASVWRIAVSTAVMSLGLRYFLGLGGYGEDFFSHIIELILAVVVGGILYIGTLLGLWWASARPAGPENHAAEAIPKLLARMGLGSKTPFVGR